MILNGGLELHPSIASLVSGLRPRLPIITCTFGNLAAYGWYTLAGGLVELVDVDERPAKPP